MSTTVTPPGTGNAVTAEAMDARLRQQLAPTRLEVLDESRLHEGHAGANGTGYGTHFRVRIAAASLQGHGRVQQHRLVYDALRPFIEAGAHAIAIEVL
ncbi:BolA family transcriptional regulator [Comamonas flocculans]|uniref:BolA family transcriptional regulator n=2 Tax=Comamonas flocculans TaxID=2597701 RepID=A0A5B8RWX7_9BURK|nr:BolA family transcriptional regulator [Comamonas flocculans]